MEDFDGITDNTQNFPQQAAVIMSIHVSIFLLNKARSGISESIPHMFKYVPVFPSTLLTIYTIYRCLESGAVWDVVREHIGMVVNNVLLIAMFVYQDFITSDVFAANRVNFVEDENQNAKTKEFYQYLEVKSEMKWHISQREEELSQFSKFDRKSYQVFFPTCLLIMNSFLMWLISVEPDDFIYFCFGLNYVLVSLMLLLVLSMPMERSCFFAYLSIDLLPIGYLLCYFSLWSEMPEMDGKTTLYGICSDYLSAPVFYTCILLFLYQIRRDYKYGRLHNAFNFSKFWQYYLTLKTPDSDWITICRKLAYVKNIEEFDVRVDTDGIVMLESKELKELLKNKIEETDDEGNSTVEDDDEVESLRNESAKEGNKTEKT